MLRSAHKVVSKTPKGLFNSANPVANASKHIQTQRRNRWDVTIDFNFRVQNEDQLTQKLQDKGAKVISQQEVTDVYFDRVAAGIAGISPEHASEKDLFTLAKRDTWLKQRNGEWHAKAPAKEEKTNATHLTLAAKDGARRVPHYREFKGEKSIRRELNLQQDVTNIAKLKSLEQDLKSRGIVPFATIPITLKQYMVSEKDKITLHLTTTKFGYSLGKIAGVVPNAKEPEMRACLNNMHNIMQELKIDHKSLALDVILEYIYRFHKNDMWKTLVDAGVVKAISEEAKMKQ